MTDPTPHPSTDSSPPTPDSAAGALAFLPPNLPPSPSRENSETEIQSSDLSPNADVVVSFSDLDAFGEAMVLNDWDIKRHVSTLLQHADNPDPRVSLSALKEFRNLRNEVLRERGILNNAKQQSTRTLPNGTTVTQTVSTQTLVSRLTNPHNSASRAGGFSVRLPGDVGPVRAVAPSAEPGVPAADLAGTDEPDSDGAASAGPNPPPSDR